MKCKLCFKESNYLELHHIIPKVRGGKDDESNLIKICSECHGKAHDVSFANERGGLIKEAVIKTEIENKIAQQWMQNNKELVENKMNNLYNENEDEHMLMLLLLEKGRFRATHIKKWCEDGKVTFKTSFTF